MPTLTNPLSSASTLRRAFGAAATAVILAFVIPVAATAIRVASAPLPTSTSDPAACLKFIPASRLANGGLTLTAARTTPMVSAAAAVTSTAQQFPGFPARDVCFVHMTDAFTDLNADVWMVDITPPGGFQFGGGPKGSPVRPTPHAFLVAVTDAQSGKFLFGRSD